jgi:hypothetical protein
MSFEFTGAWGVPGIAAALETVEKQIWWNRWEDQVWVPAVIDGTARDAGNTSYTDVLRPGLLLGQIRTTGKLKEWDPTDTDGTHRLYGVLGHSVKIQRLGANQDRFIGWVMVAGRLKADNVIVPGQTAWGLSGQTLEFLAKAQLAGRFLLIDEASNVLQNRFGGWADIQAKTADYTVLEADNNTIFTTRGAAGAVNFTLPATAKKGLHYGFYSAANQDMTVTAGTADTMTVINDLTADSIAISTTNLKIGGFVEVFGDGTAWNVIFHPGQTSDGTTSGQLATIAT